MRFLFLLVACLIGCIPTGEGGVATTASPSTEGTSSTEGDSSGSGDSESTGAEETTSGLETETGWGSGGSGTSSTGSTSGGELELCHEYPVYCSDLGGLCPDGSSGEGMPVSNMVVLDFFRLAFVDLGLIPCFTGNSDDSVEVALYLRVIGKDFDPEAQADFCLVNALNERFDHLYDNPAQISLLPDLPDGTIFKEDGEQKVLWYGLCGTSPQSQVTSLLLANDTGMGKQAPLSIASVAMQCSQGDIQPLVSAPSLLFDQGEVELPTPGCFVNGDQNGAVEVSIFPSGQSGTFRIEVVNATGAMVLGPSAPTYLVQ